MGELRFFLGSWETNNETVLKTYRGKYFNKIYIQSRRVTFKLKRIENYRKYVNGVTLTNTQWRNRDRRSSDCNESHPRLSFKLRM